MRFLVGLVAVIAVSATAVHAYDLGPLNAFVTPSEQGNWRIVDVGDAAVFENRSVPGDINFAYVFSDPADEGRRDISVDVGVLNGDRYAKAGLLYGFESDPRTYFMFTVSADRTVRLEYRSTSGWEEPMAFSLGDLDPTGVNLAIRESGNEIALIVNGQEKAAFGNGRVGRGGVGIVAAGIGQFAFNGFKVNAAQAAATPADDAPTPQPDRRVAEADASPDASASASAMDGVLHIKPVELTDAHGFEKPIPAATTLIPASWTFNGQVQYSTSPCAREPKMVFKAASADGKVSVSMLPAFTVSWSSLGQSTACPFHRALRAEDMIQPVLGNQLTNPKVIEINRDPAMTEQLARAAQRSPRFSQYGDHLVATIEHDNDGERYRSHLMLFTQHQHTVQPMAYGSPAEITVTTVMPVVYDAPKSEFGKPEHTVAQSLIFSSFQRDPQWSARIGKGLKAMADDDRRTAESIAKMRRETNTFIASLNASSRAQADASNDRNHRRTLEMLTETQTVQTSSGPVRLPAGQAWQAANGSLFVSQNPNFNPSSVGISAKRLQAVR
ncbi:MAG: hypothetical protein AAGA11_20865 [Pseudomonadota bacterium]